MTVIALLVLASAVSNASARNFSISSSNFRITWNGLVMTSFFGEVRTACNLTVQGTFLNRTIAKQRGGLIGRITAARVGTCTGDAEVYALNGEEELDGGIVGQTLPWHIVYEGFLGALPAVVAVKVEIVGASLLFEDEFGLPCLYVSTREAPWHGRFELNGSGLVTGFRSDETLTIGLEPNGGGFCPVAIRAAGSGGVQILNSTTGVTIRLI
jgi:hypothetical protein